MEKWGELSLAKKEQLISKYGVTAVGNPPEPLSAKEYFKIPEEEFGPAKEKKVKKVSKPKKVKEVAKKPKSKEIKVSKTTKRIKKVLKRKKK